MNAVDQIKVEQHVDIFQILRRMKLVRPEFVENLVGVYKFYSCRVVYVPPQVCVHTSEVLSNRVLFYQLCLHNRKYQAMFSYVFTANFFHISYSIQSWPKIIWTTGKNGVVPDTVQVQVVQAMYNQFKRPSTWSVRELYYIYRKT